MSTVAEHIVAALADQGVTHGLGRRRRRAEPGHRRDPPRATASSGSACATRRRARSPPRAQAQLTGTLGVCMGTVGPGLDPPAQRALRREEVARAGARPLRPGAARRARHRLLPGGRQRRAVRRRRRLPPHDHSPEQLPGLLEQAVQRALTERGVAVLTLPGDVGGLDLPKGTRRAARSSPRRPTVVPDAGAARATPRPRDRRRPGTVTLLVGIGAREARDGGARAGRAAGGADGAHPQGQGGARARQPVPGRPDRPDRQPGRAPRASTAATCCSCSAPTSRTATGIRRARSSSRSTQRGAHIGRRTRSTSASSATPGSTAARRCSTASRPKADRDHLEDADRALRGLARATSSELADPDYERQRARAQAALEVRQPRRAHPPRGARRRASTATPPPTRSSPPTPACRRSGSRASSTMTRHAPADRLLQPRLDGQRDAAGARRAGARPRRAR